MILMPILTETWAYRLLIGAALVIVVARTTTRVNFWNNMGQSCFSERASGNEAKGQDQKARGCI